MRTYDIIVRTQNSEKKLQSRICGGISSRVKGFSWVQPGVSQKEGQSHRDPTHWQWSGGPESPGSHVWMAPQAILAFVAYQYLKHMSMGWLYNTWGTILCF